MEFEEGISVMPLEDKGDQRGESFALPNELFEFLGSVEEVHLAEIKVGAVRGNHGHNLKKEVLVVWYEDQCRFGWKKHSEFKITEFNGKGALLIAIEPKVLHALKNTGDKKVQIIAFSNMKHDPEKPDTYWETLL
ncbi:MAG: hypothetical protein GY869_07840 [Planctomycetes bacterium]|nr:hypothetical protein [Planctomycetota bacterium]